MRSRAPPIAVDSTDNAVQRTESRSLKRGIDNEKNMVPGSGGTPEKGDTTANGIDQRIDKGEKQWASVYDDHPSQRRRRTEEKGE